MAVSHETGASGMFLDIIGHCVCVLTILSIVYAIAPVGRGAGHDTTPGGSRVGTYQTRAQTRAQTNPQPEVVNGGQPRVAAPNRVQEQVIQDAPSTVPAVVPTIALPTDIVMGLLNVLEALVSNHGGLPVPQTTLQAQTQVQSNVAAAQAPQLTPQPMFIQLQLLGNPKILRISWILTHQSSMEHQFLLNLRCSLTPL
ncbi:hypothetical protein HAX54_010728 [Datura stramonium]|uniref:Uncharacterized protein n=1 Tax=Datura stramonium TaxID=4076 RepID=A0ABS8TIP1_DATST|nr:hypothetical protein [Datura stramonium]